MCVCVCVCVFLTACGPHRPAETEAKRLLLLPVQCRPLHTYSQDARCVCVSRVVCVCLYGVYVYMCVFVSAGLCVCACMVCVCVYVCVCLSRVVCVCVCVSVWCVYVFMCVFVSASVFVPPKVPDKNVLNAETSPHSDTSALISTARTGYGTKTHTRGRAHTHTHTHTHTALSGG